MDIRERISVEDEELLQTWSKGSHEIGFIPIRAQIGFPRIIRNHFMFGLTCRVCMLVYKFDAVIRMEECNGKGICSKWDVRLLYLKLYRK